MAYNSYYARKIHSLLGVIPIGFFLIEHFLSNYESVNGNAAFTKQVEWLHHLPFLFFLELFLVWLPLLYHGIYGLYMTYQSQINVGRYGYYRNWMYTLQRVTGVITFIFIVWHVAQTRLQVALGNVAYEDLGKLMVDVFANPVSLTLYIIAIVAASFHFANGMWLFLAQWGITVGPRAQRISSVVWMVFFVVFALVGILAALGFRDPDFFTKGV
ncbi:MAG TPA: succinate dehydrogenase [Bacilli bacterium]